MNYKLSTGILFFILFPFIAFSQQKNIESVRVFYMGGQSNMVGFGYNKDLPEDLQKPLENVWIFQGNAVGDEEENGGLGKWEALKPGHGLDFKSDGNKNHLSDRFGTELSFAKKLKELYPNEKIAIIKYARNGSSIDSLIARNWGSWEIDYKGKTGVNQFDHFLSTIKNALSIKDIDNDGVEEKLVPSGIIWMQGESDAHTEITATNYYSNLKRLMDLIRATLREDDLPIVIGKISDSGGNDVGKVWRYGELVQYAQEKYANTDANAVIVRSTKKYSYTDKYHYTSDGYLDLGEKFADAIFKLKNN
jgi:hypothetical protein